MKTISIHNIGSIGRQGSGTWVTINPNTGDILFSPEFSEKIGSRKILFHQDEDRPKDWFIEITDANDGIPVRQEKQRKYKRLQSVGLTAMIMLELNLDTTHRFLIGEPENGLYAIITKSAMQIRRNKH